MYGISNSQQQGGGGGSAASITYTKLSGDVEFSSTRPSASSAFFVNTDAANWALNGTMGRKTLTSTSDLGLVIGNSYTMDVNIDGTSYTFSGTATDMGLSGMKLMSLRNESKGGFVIYDHCDFSAGYPQADNGAIILSALSPTPTSAMITDFNGELQIVSPVTIEDTAIKTNSSVTMYINSDITVRGTKTDGSITLTASTEGSLSYEMEIIDTPTEGLFEIINGYVPTIPEITLPQWHTIYEDTTGTGVTSAALSEPLKGGELYRITISGTLIYTFVPTRDASNSLRSFYISNDTIASNNSYMLSSYEFNYTNNEIMVGNAVQCALIETGVSGFLIKNGASMGILISKVEVYR